MFPRRPNSTSRVDDLNMVREDELSVMPVLCLALSNLEDRIDD